MTLSEYLPASETEQAGIRVGLRVDVDTYSGTRDGIPTLLQSLHDAGIKASFFFTLGPDNMGRHVWRLFKPAFLAKMLRSNAPQLYGWDILTGGLVGNGSRIGEKLNDVIASVEVSGHEVGLHAWDHHCWQSRVDGMSSSEIREQLRMAAEEFSGIFGHPPSSSACAGWKCNETVLIEKEDFSFVYNSDCRGTSIFRPLAGGRSCVPQIPVTLPTYDEIIGNNGINDSNYNDHLLSLIRPGQLNVYTIHAEVEGMSRSGLFQQLLQQASEQRIEFVPLITLLQESSGLAISPIVQGPIAGREGVACWQAIEAVHPASLAHQGSH